MKKFLLSAVLIIGFGLYIMFDRQSSQVAVTPPGIVRSNNPTTAPVSSATKSSNPVKQNTNQPAANPNSNQNSAGSGMGMSNSGSMTMNQGRYNDGTYTGSVADAFYGPMQVAVVIQGGKITDVQFLQYPNDRSYSIFVNSQAMPYLKAETIQAQSAQVDIVSGATQSSMAFIQSLGSALAQAS